jgi:hypothetical protein
MLTLPNMWIYILIYIYISNKVCVGQGLEIGTVCPPGPPPPLLYCPCLRPLPFPSVLRSEGKGSGRRQRLYRTRGYRGVRCSDNTEGKAEAAERHTHTHRHRHTHTHTHTHIPYVLIASISKNYNNWSLRKL